MSNMENQQEQQDVATTCDFRKKMWSLPLVRSAAGLALSMYSRAKDYNSVSKTTFDKAEKTITSVATFAKPLLVKIEAPLIVANQVACIALAKLEEKVPAIAMTHEDIESKAKQMWNDALKPAVDRYNTAVVYGTEKLNSAKVYGLTKANEVLETPVGKKVAGSLDELIVWADERLDSSFPPSDSEGETKPLTGNVVNKATTLSLKTARKLRKHADDRIAAVKTFVFDTYTKSSVHQHIQAIKKRIDATKLAIANRTSQIMDAPARLKEQANKLSAYAKGSYDRLQSTGLPEGLRTAVSATKSYADKLYTPISQAKTLGEVSTAVLNNITTVALDLKMAARNSIKSLRSSATSTKASDASENSQ